MKIKLTIFKLFIVGLCMAQDKFDVDGNNLSNNAKLGSLNNKSLKIITNNQTRAIFNKDGDINFLSNVYVDSIKVAKMLKTDSIVTKFIKVGNNSLYIGNPPSQPILGLSDNIQSSNGVINFGRIFVPPGIPQPFQNINVSIGSAFTGPFSAARARLFVNGRTGINVTNPLSTLGVSGNAAFGAGFGGSNAPVNGLIVEGYTGIGVVAPATQLEIFSPFPNAQFRISRFLGQRFTDFESTTSGDMFIAPKDLTLLGNAQQRFVGIHTNTPGNSLEINSQATSTAQSYAGLRFTDLTSTSPTIANTSNKVLSVDANGDVVLVPDGGPGGGGTVAPVAQNGLNTTVASPFVELGGNLIRPTAVTMDNAGTPNDMVFNGDGQFGVGNNLLAPGNLSLGNDTKFYVDFLQTPSNPFNRSFESRFTSTTSVNNNIYSGYFTTSGSALTTNGIYVESKGSSTSGIFGVNAIAESTVVGSDNTFGVYGTAINGANNHGGVFYALNGSFGYGVEGYSTASHESIGVNGIAENGIGLRAMAGNFEARNFQGISGLPLCIGVRAMADNGGLTTNQPNVNIGVYGVANSAIFSSVGVYGDITGVNGPINYNVAAAIMGASQPLSSSTAYSMPVYAGYFIMVML